METQLFTNNLYKLLECIYLHQDEKISQSDMAILLKLERRTIARYIKKLSELSYIEKHSYADYRVTDSGLEIVKKFMNNTTED